MAAFSVASACGLAAAGELHSAITNPSFFVIIVAFYTGIPTPSDVAPGATAGLSWPYFVCCFAGSSFMYAIALSAADPMHHVTLVQAGSSDGD